MVEATFVLLFVLNPLTILLAILFTKEVFMSDVQKAIDEITGVLLKAQDEIVAEIAKLEASLADGVTPDLSTLKAVAASLDAIVPDAE